MALRILLLCHSFNSLSQRLYAELRARGHCVSVELDIADPVTSEAIDRFQPDLLLAPFLKRRLPAAVWQRLPCWVVHPGPPGDQGPSALDWALLQQRSDWGVTLLQATDALDAGPVWASARLALRAASKGSLYRREVTEAALAVTLTALARWQDGQRQPPALPAPTPHWQPLLPQSARAIDWQRDGTEAVLARLRSADGQPGVRDALWGQPCYLYDAHPASAACLHEFRARAAGEWLARRDGALLRRTRDGAVWIGQLRLADPSGTAPGQGRFKLKAEEALRGLKPAAQLPDWPVALERADDEWGELRYREYAEGSARVGWLSFDFYNGAMSSAQCERLRRALLEVCQRPTQVLVLAGGDDFFSNGIDLNAIEAAAHVEGDSAADASWRNIEAMNDLALAILQRTERLTVSVLRGNAGAGGAFLALAADQVWAHHGVVLNPHYKNMGNLYGSEYWTYLLPRRLGAEGARDLMAQRLPLLASQAERMGLIDHCDPGPRAGFEQRVLQRGLALAAAPDWPQQLAAKQQRRAADEAQRPLAQYRHDEMERMKRNFYGFDPSYHVARHHFVHKLAHAWTPRHLAIHR
ncbi:MAG: enoyl-CoA hydratase-related protein [Pseudomonadota bacterium]|jgi:putative two-component system hydrogenase maturation factor HypX/HoxX